MQDPTTRCDKCSSRTTVVMVPSDEFAEHQIMHREAAEEFSAERSAWGKLLLDNRV